MISLFSVCDDSYIALTHGYKLESFLLQGSAAMLLRFGGIGLMTDCCIANLLEMWQQTNFENRPVFDEVMRIEYCGLLFLDHDVFKVWGYRGGSATAVRPSDPALSVSCPLVTPYYCRLGDLLCFVFIVRISVFFLLFV